MGKSPICWIPLFLMVVSTTVSDSRGADDAKRGRMLMVTDSQGFKHGAVTRDKEKLSPAEISITQLGQSSGLFTVDCTQNAKADFTKENLAKYDMVFFYTTGNLGIAEADLDYFFKEWLPSEGHGFIGAHSASDTYGDYQPYWDLVGGTFNGHPWNAGETVTITVHDTAHPGTKRGGASSRSRTKSTSTRIGSREGAGVDEPQHGQNTDEKAVPRAVSWVKNYGHGRVFYTNLGHNPETWANPTFVKSMEGGIRWVMGLERGDATPNPELSAAQEEKAKKDVGE